MNPLPPKTSEPERHRKRRLWAALIALAVIPVIAASIFYGRFYVYGFLSARNAVRTADAGFKKAKQTINAEDLRTWALETIKRYPDTNDGSPSIPQSEIPKYIRDLYSQPPFETAVLQRGSNQSSVLFMWGGGLFAWSIEVGQTNLISETNPEYPRTFTWAPGIYYTRESSWDLQ